MTRLRADSHREISPFSVYRKKGARSCFFIYHGANGKFFGTLISFFRTFISFFRTFISPLCGEFSFAPCSFLITSVEIAFGGE